MIFHRLGYIKDLDGIIGGEFTKLVDHGLMYYYQKEQKHPVMGDYLYSFNNQKETTYKTKKPYWILTLEDLRKKVLNHPRAVWLTRTGRSTIYGAHGIAYMALGKGEIADDINYEWDILRVNDHEAEHLYGKGGSGNRDELDVRKKTHTLYESPVVSSLN